MRKRGLHILIGLACAIIFLVLSLRRVEFRTVLEALSQADPSWLIAALLVYSGNLLIRAWRWQLILRQVKRIPYGGVVKALVVGYGLNSIFPARLGELFRAEFLKQAFGLLRVQALTSIVVERLLDGLVVVGCLGLGLAMLRVDSNSAHLLVILFLSGGAVFGIVLMLCLLARAKLLRIFRRWPELAARMEIASSGLAIVGDLRFVALLMLTCAVYIPDALSVWCIVRATGVALGAPDLLVLVGAASLSTLLPSGPGFIGNLQFSYALTMQLVGISSAVGVAAATLAQLCLFLPIAVIAVVILSVESRKMLGMLIHSGKRDRGIA